ncbi:MAG: LL-diaminopimelate aminotransferase [Pseudoflavonifractor sp.]
MAATINPNYPKLPGNYLFSEIARRVEAYSAGHPDAALIRLGIGDVTRPLAPAVIAAMHAAVEEMGSTGGFRGYGPEQGYAFLRTAIAAGDYADTDITPDEIFVSDGAKSDCGNMGDIFGTDNIVAVCDPVYPVYVDASAMAGRAGEFDPKTGTWSRLLYLPCLAENGFMPEPPREIADLIYLCSPNNPTGAAATKKQLRAWVDYANGAGAVILFDAAYEAFITDPDLPHSIFEISGAQTCAIEFRSFSKTAGFTGNRCAYTVVPKALQRDGVSLHALWNRRQCTKFNGAAYIVQRGAAAIYIPQGRQEIRANIGYYQQNAKVILAGLTAAGLKVSGGKNSPYLWAETPEHLPSWDFFDLLLRQAGVVTTPGGGFGPHGEGYIRLTAFGDAAETQVAVARIQKLL